MANHIQITCRNIYKNQEENMRRKIFTRQWATFINQKEGAQEENSGGGALNQGEFSNL